MTKISEFYEPVRAFLGDLHPRVRKYEDTRIAATVRSAIRCDRVPGFTLTPDRLNITPAVSQPRDFARITYHTCLIFISPGLQDYSYATRAIKERFGNNREFVNELHRALYHTENGAMFGSWQSFYGWVDSIIGVNLFSPMTKLEVDAPVQTVTVGQNGIVTGE